MANEIERSLNQPEPRREPTEFTVFAREARLLAESVDLGGVVSLDEIRLEGRDISLRPGGSIRVGELQASLVISEAALNRFLANRRADTVRDLQVAMLDGKVRIHGRYSLPLGIGVPFTFTGVPEIEGGARVRLDPRHMSLVGAPVPGLATGAIGDRVNALLADALDVTRFPLAVRLTALTVETGRLTLSATAAVELTPPQR